MCQRPCLEVAIEEGPVYRFENSGPGLRRLLQHMAARGLLRWCARSPEGMSGSWWAVSGPPASRCRWPIRYGCAPSRVCGYEAKPDAQMLARCGQVFPASDPGPLESEEEREEPQQLLRRHRQLVDQRVQEWNRLDKAYQALLQRSVSFCPQTALYRRAPEVGALTAALLVAFLPELGQRDSKASTSLVGLTPWLRDSGHKRG